MKLIKSSCLFFMLLTSSAFADSVVVNKVQGVNVPAKEMTINNMSHVDNMLTAGRYAWAMNDTQIAFYNGKNWVNAESFPELHNLNYFPLYPTDGKSPEGFLYGYNKIKGDVIKTFNGKSWSDSKQVDQILALENENAMRVCQLKTVSGCAYLVCGLESGNDKSTVYAAYNAKKHTWTKPVKIEGSIGMPLQMQTGNDAKPNLYMLNRPKPTKFSLVEVTPDGKYQETNLDTSKKVPDYPWSSNLYRNKNNLIIDFGTVFMRSNFNNPTEFTTIDYPPVGMALMTYFTGDNIYLFESFAHSDVRKGPGLKLRVFDNKQPEFAWSSPLTISDNWNSISVLEKEKDAWILLKEDDKSLSSYVPRVFDFNPSTNTYVDTQFPLLTEQYTDYNLENVALDGKQSLVCTSTDARHSGKNAQLFSYKNKLSAGKWVEIKISKAIKNCKFSEYDHYNNSFVDINNLWIYHQNGMFAQMQKGK